MLIIYILNIVSQFRSAAYLIHVSYAALTAAYTIKLTALTKINSKIVMCVFIFYYYIIKITYMSRSNKHVYTYIGSVDGRAWMTERKGGTCDTCHITHTTQRVTYYHISNTHLTCHICVLPTARSPTISVCHPFVSPLYRLTMRLLAH